MPRLTRKLTTMLFLSVVCVLALTLWLVLRFRNTPSNPARPGVCEEWEKAEVVNQGLGWDLTYMSLLKRKGLCPGDPICEVWATVEPPIQKHVVEWQGDPIVSSMEIELPDGHADMIALWFIRTKDHAYYWAFYPLIKDNPEGKQPISAQEYDSAFDVMSCWQQDVPPNKAFSGDEGYIGFLSLYKEGKSRQMLLTYRDLFEGNKDPEKAQPGRYFKVMRPLMSSIEKVRKPSSPEHK